MQYIIDGYMLDSICSYRSESGGLSKGKGTNGTVADSARRGCEQKG